MCGQCRVSAAILPEQSSRTRCSGGLVSSIAGLEGCGKSRTHQVRSPVTSVRSESLYRLCCLDPHFVSYSRNNLALSIFDVVQLRKTIYSELYFFKQFKYIAQHFISLLLCYYQPSNFQAAAVLFFIFHIIKS